MALNIQKHNIVDCKKQNNIPDSDWFELGRQGKDSTAYSDSHVQKINRSAEIHCCKSLCSRMCNYLSNLNISCSKVVARGLCVGTATFP